MKVSKRILQLLLSAILLGGSLNAGLVKKAQVGFRFLENPVSAAAIGRGGLGMTMSRNSNAVFWNPSGLGWMNGKFQFFSNTTLGIADINYHGLVAAVKMPAIGMIALDFINVDYGTLRGTRRALNDAGYTETGDFSPSAWSTGITISRKVSARFSWGVRLKYVYQDLGDAYISKSGTSLDDTSLVITTKKYDQSLPAIDIGTTYDFNVHGLRFAAVMQNFSREIHFEEQDFPLPFNIGFSLSFRPLELLAVFGSEHDLVVGAETIHPRDYREKYKLGAEYSYHKSFIIRTGYAGNYDEQSLSFGLGFRYRYSQVRTQIDYAFSLYGIFGLTHSFSFGITL